MVSPPAPNVPICLAHFIPFDGLLLLVLEVEQPLGADVDAHVANLVGPDAADDDENQQRDKEPGETYLGCKDPDGEQNQDKSQDTQEDHDSEQGSVEGIDFFDLSQL